MKKNTITWRIFKYNLVVIIMLITLVTIIFNVAVRIYMERDILEQLQKIASRIENTALQQEPDFPPIPRSMPPPDVPDNNELFRSYFMLDHSLREPLSVLNADYILLDESYNRINPFPEGFIAPSAELKEQITQEINKSTNFKKESYLNFRISGTNYIAIVKPVTSPNTSGLGWVIIYSSLQKINQLQMGINVILFVILIISSLVIVAFSSALSKKISAPFSSLNQYIRTIAERNFGTKINISVDDELQELVNNINIMSEKLATYDKAQKTFLQNASHEFRTPLMSIQSYAEGIKYDVVDQDTAINVIIDEAKRMTCLVEDLLYLSRLDAIEENYHFENLDFNDLIQACIERTNGIALQNNVAITVEKPNETVVLYADEEKLSRAIVNVISNCIRYAENAVSIRSKIIKFNMLEITIMDDGPGFEENELPNIFDRFFKGKKGNYGLGLTISKNILGKHNGNIRAQNLNPGALFVIELPIAGKQGRF